MLKLLKLGSVVSAVSVSLTTISCSNEIENLVTISFDASYENINTELIDSRLNLDRFQDKELSIIIYNINGKDIVKDGFINKDTILIPGQEELVNLIEWVEYIVEQTPSGSSKVGDYYVI